jgi:hypothetical protein
MGQAKKNSQATLLGIVRSNLCRGHKCHIMQEIR